MVAFIALVAPKAPPAVPNLIKIIDSPNRPLDGLGCFANI